MSNLHIPYLRKSFDSSILLNRPPLRNLPNDLFSKPRSNPDLMKTKRRFLRCFSFPGVWRQLLPADDQVHPLEGDPGPLPGEGGDLHAGQVRGHLRQVLQHVSRSKSDSRYCMAS